MRASLLSALPLVSFALTPALIAQQQPGAPMRIRPAAVPSHAGPDKPASLPVTRVSLYKNGVGFFEHTGHVTGNADVSIDFTTAQLNDVLQSLTAIDLNGGRISGAGYNSTTPLEQQLRALPLALGEDPTAADFYAAIRGARVEVHSGAASITGRLLSVEQRAAPSKDAEDTSTQNPVVKHFITVVSDSGEVRTLELTSTTSVRLLDTDLHQDVTRYLQLLAGNRSQGLRHLTLNDRGTGSRELRVSYISEVPIWKSTYRILFTDASKSASTQTATLQGWAVVDNTVGEDWTNVQLSLIAGAPQSFIQPLSDPIYSRRPEIPIVQEAQLTPQTFDSSNEQSDKFMASPVRISPGIVSQKAVNKDRTFMGFGSAGGVMGGIVPSSSPMPPPPAVSYEEAATASLTTSTQTAAFDDFFEYKLSEPITIRKNESALVPILQAKVNADRVTLVSYSGNRTSQPLRALWVTNTTGLTLDRGSFSIVENGNFGGEGLFDPIHSNEKRLLSYAADQAVHVSTESDKTSNRITLLRGSRGVLNIHRADVHEVTFVIHNSAADHRIVVTEVPVVNGWELDSDPKPEETTPTVYRFRTEVAPGETARLHVGAKHNGYTTYRLTGSDDNQLNFFLNESGHNPALEAALQPIFEARHKVADAQTAVNQTNAKLKNLREEEERQRANITALATADKASRDRFVHDLNTTEDEIKATQTELTTRTTALGAAKVQLDVRIDQFSIDQNL